jgi:hypothetical protein
MDVIVEVASRHNDDERDDRGDTNSHAPQRKGHREPRDPRSFRPIQSRMDPRGRKSWGDGLSLATHGLGVNHGLGSTTLENAISTLSPFSPSSANDQPANLEVEDPTGVAVGGIKAPGFHRGGPPPAPGDGSVSNPPWVFPEDAIRSYESRFPASRVDHLCRSETGDPPLGI